MKCCQVLLLLVFIAEAVVRACQTNEVRALLVIIARSSLFLSISSLTKARHDSHSLLRYSQWTRGEPFGRDDGTHWRRKRLDPVVLGSGQKERKCSPKDPISVVHQDHKAKEWTVSIVGKVLGDPSGVSKQVRCIRSCTPMATDGEWGLSRSGLHHNGRSG